MNPQTEIILAFVMNDIHYYQEWLSDLRSHMYLSEQIRDKITTFIHDKTHESVMIELCDLLLEDVDWVTIADEIQNYRD